MRRDWTLLRSKRCPFRVGLNPALPPELRHGSVWFEVGGFGKMRRDFLVNDRDLLVEHAHRYALKVAYQIVLLDPSLPKRSVLCKPLQIDLVGTHIRRVYEFDSMRLTLEQHY